MIAVVLTGPAQRALCAAISALLRGTEHLAENTHICLRLDSRGDSDGVVIEGGHIPTYSFCKIGHRTPEFEATAD